MEEIWKDIKDYEGCYQISNLGRVKSLKRLVPCCYGCQKVIKERIIRSGRYKGGYLRIELNTHKSEKPKKYFLHRLLAIHFIPNPFNFPDINHIDGNPSNNNLNNLEWSNPSLNGLHAYRTGLNKSLMMENHHLAKLTRNEVVEIRTLHATGNYNYKQLADIFKISGTNTRDIIKRKTWKYI